MIRIFLTLKILLPLEWLVLRDVEIFFPRIMNSIFMKSPISSFAFGIVGGMSLVGVAELVLFKSGTGGKTNLSVFELIVFLFVCFSILYIFLYIYLFSRLIASEFYWESREMMLENLRFPHEIALLIKEYYLSRRKRW